MNGIYVTEYFTISSPLSLTIKRTSGIPSGPYMSVYMPTRTADVILPMHRNGRTTNAYGYMHQ